MRVELFPGLTTYFRGWDSSCLYRFFEMFEYLAKASFLAWRNFSYSWAADSNGFGNFLGGKYLGFFTSSYITSLPSSSLAPSTPSPSFPPALLAPLFVDSGATRLQLSFFLPPSSPSFTPIFNFWNTLPFASLPFIWVPSFFIVPNYWPNF